MLKVCLHQHHEHHLLITSTWPFMFACPWKFWIVVAMSAQRDTFFICHMCKGFVILQRNCWFGIWKTAGKFPRLWWHSNGVHDLCQWCLCNCGAHQMSKPWQKIQFLLFDCAQWQHCKRRDCDMCSFLVLLVWTRLCHKWKASKCEICLTFQPSMFWDLLFPRLSCRLPGNCLVIARQLHLVTVFWDQSLVSTCHANCCSQGYCPNNFQWLPKITNHQVKVAITKPVICNWVDCQCVKATLLTFWFFWLSKSHKSSILHNNCTHDDMVHSNTCVTWNWNVIALAISFEWQICFVFLWFSHLFNTGNFQAWVLWKIPKIDCRKKCFNFSKKGKSHGARTNCIHMLPCWAWESPQNSSSHCQNSKSATHIKMELKKTWIGAIACPDERSAHCHWDIFEVHFHWFSNDCMSALHAIGTQPTFDHVTS